MRKLALSLVAAACLAMAGDATLTGWISDASCGVGNANDKAESRECAERCIKSGAAPVFVSDADQKVYKIADGSKVMAHLKHKVKVTGQVKGDTLSITGIEKAD